MSTGDETFATSPPAAEKEATRADEAEQRAQVAPVDEEHDEYPGAADAPPTEDPEAPTADAVEQQRPEPQDDEELPGR